MSTADMPEAKLIVTRGGTIGREFPLRKPQVMIGRWDREQEPQPDIELADEDLEAHISRSHARIEYRGGCFYLLDCGSQNGSFINRQRCQVPFHPYPLANGDEVALGPLFFRFVVGP